MTNMTKPKLSKLRGDAPDPPEATPDRVWVVYDGYSEPDRVLQHVGSHTVYAGPDAGFIQFHPGLSFIDGAKWAAGKDHANVKDLVGDQVTVTDEQLRGYTAKGKLRDLAERSTQPEALELILQLEQAKPITTGHNRRDSKLVEKLKNRIEAYSRRRPFSFDNLHNVGTARATG